MKNLRFFVPVAIVAFGCTLKALAVTPPGAPEISPNDGIAALALVAGAATIFRSRIKR